MKRILVLVVCLIMVISFSQTVGAEEFRVGINNFGQANFFARIGRDVMIEEVENLGGTPFPTVTDNVPDRNNAIENYIANDVDVIIIQEGDIQMAEPVLSEASDLGILIVSMGAGTADFVDVVVESNEWVMGAKAATELMHRIDGEGQLVEIYNDLGQMIRMRRKMLHAVITEYDNVDIAAGFVYAWPDFFPDVMNQMESVLQSNPNPGDIAGVFATFDGAGVAASHAIREAGLEDHISVIGIDGDPQAYEEMRNPNSPFKATIAQDPETMARTAVKKAFALYNGEELDRSHFYIPAEIVTIEDVQNMDDEEFEEISQDD